MNTDSITVPSPFGARLYFRRVPVKSAIYVLNDFKLGGIGILKNP